MTNHGKTQVGWTRYGVLGLILSTITGVLSFGALVRFVPDGATISTPYIFISLFILPLAFCVQLLFKVWDLKEQDGLSREEKRRLNPIIEGKSRQIFIAIIYCILSPVIIAAMFFFSSFDAGLFKAAIVITGGLLGITIFSIIIIFLEMKELVNFKAKIKQRSDEKKKQRAALKRLVLEKSIPEKKN